MFSGSTPSRTKSDVEMFGAVDFQDAVNQGGFTDTGSSGNDRDMMLLQKDKRCNNRTAYY